MAAPAREHSEVVEDEVLVERLQSGDEAAFEELYERYFKRIAHFVRRRMNNQADAEETVQEDFINVISSIGNYRGDAPFVAWVFGLTRRTIANRYKRKRHPTVSMEEEDTSVAISHPATPYTLPTPDQVYDGEERARQLDTALVQKLSSEQQQLFKLHHMEERPIAEIAEMLGKSEDSVKSNLYRTRKLLLAN